MIDTRAARIARLVQLRQLCQARGDWNLVAEINGDLFRLGFDEEDLVSPLAPETTVAVTVEETAVPPRPRRGRPPNSVRFPASNQPGDGA